MPYHKASRTQSGANFGCFHCCHIELFDEIALGVHTIRVSHICKSSYISGTSTPPDLFPGRCTPVFHIDENDKCANFTPKNALH